MKTPVIETCIVCNRPVPDYEPQFCCNGHDCGCRGMPTEPCICSNECWDKMINKAEQTTEDKK
jgi:hypothetical protein